MACIVAAPFGFFCLPPLLGLRPKTAPRGRFLVSFERRVGSLKQFPVSDFAVAAIKLFKEIVALVPYFVPPVT